MGFGDIDGPQPCKFVWSGDIGALSLGWRGRVGGHAWEAAPPRLVLEGLRPGPACWGAAPPTDRDQRPAT